MKNKPKKDGPAWLIFPTIPYILLGSIIGFDAKMLMVVQFLRSNVGISPTMMGYHET
jgi:hypothetical protein